LEPSFGWVSLTPKALARARGQLNAESQGVRDEVGFLLLHQRYADRFFPGTSVLHTRLRYALFVPWQFEAERGKHTAVAERARAASEIALAKRLKDGLQAGAIGGSTWPNAPDQSPSSIYWSALDAWGILRRDARGRTPTRRGVHERFAVARPTLDDEGEPLFGYEPPFVTLPPPGEDWTSGGPLSFALLADERAFLAERLSSVLAPAPCAHLSLLSQLARSGAPLSGSLWSRAVLDLAGRDRAALQRARSSAALAAIGRGVYAALVETLRDRVDKRETPHRHRSVLPKLVDEHRARALELGGRGLDLVEGDVGVLPPKLRQLMAETLEWLDRGGGDPMPLLDPYEAAEGRKQERARLRRTPGARMRRAEWQAHDHPVGYPLHYRWASVRRLLDDLRAPAA